MKSYFTLVAGKIEKATKESAAFDLFYNPDYGLIEYKDGGTIAVPTGVRSIFSSDLVAIIKEKSGLALKGLEVHGGVIDADYRDEWKVIVTWNPNSKLDPASIIVPGRAIAQFILFKLPEVDYNTELNAEIIFRDSIRKGGFGSTQM